MELPDKIKLGFQDIEIHRVKSDFFNNIENAGDFNDKTNVIRLQEGLNNFDEVNILIHELIHGILIHAGLCGKGQILEDEHHAELVTNLLANGLTGLFRDNKPLLLFFYAKLHGFEEGDLKI